MCTVVVVVIIIIVTVAPSLLYRNNNIRCQVVEPARRVPRKGSDDYASWGGLFGPEIRLRPVDTSRPPAETIPPNCG